MRLDESVYRGLVEAAPDAMVVVDAEGSIVMVNAQAERLFGYGRGELVGRSVETLIPGRSRAAHIAHREGYAASPRAREMGSGLELLALAKDGREFPVEVSLSPLETASGTIVASAIRDVSARKVLEAELRSKNEVLLVEAERAESASRAKSRFLANMSHELRTPLNSIIGFTEIIHDGRAGAVSPDQKEFLGDVLSSARHLLRLINDVLDLSKVEAGKTQFALAELDVQALLGRAAEMLAPQAQQRAIQVVVEEAPPLIAVSDRDRLKQVLYNLLSNAIKFSPTGSQVRLRARREDGGRFRMEVEDFGPGITEADQARLFGEFVQLDEDTNKRHSGSGLGLSLSRRIVELLGGEVGLKSRVGHGSVFFVILPSGPAPAEN